MAREGYVGARESQRSVTVLSVDRSGTTTIKTYPSLHNILYVDILAVGESKRDQGATASPRWLYVATVSRGVSTVITFGTRNFQYRIEASICNVFRTFVLFYRTFRPGIDRSRVIFRVSQMNATGAGSPDTVALRTMLIQGYVR